MSAPETMPMLSFTLPPQGPPLPEPPPRERIEPRPLSKPRLLSPAELRQFCDAWVHHPSYVFNVGVETLMIWDEQLWIAIQNGFDGRASWEIAANDSPSRELVSRLADLLLADLGVRL